VVFRAARQHFVGSVVAGGVIELVVAFATLTAFGYAMGAQHHRRQVASRALDRYARSRGLVFVPPPVHPRGASPRIVGAKDGVGFVVELFRLGDEVRTRASATAPRGRAPVVSLLQRGVFAEAATSAPIGNDALDQRYIATIGGAYDLETLREASYALLLLDDRCRGVWLASDGQKTTVSWRGTESEPTVLDAACELVVRIAGIERPAAPYR
jgi:hypothetical protein